MLQTIREHTQGWIAGIIITLIILSFGLWGIHSYFEGGASPVNVAQVNSTDITREQLTVAYERLRRQVQTQYGANTLVTAKDETILKDRALQTLISIEVLKQASLAQGFRVSNHQIDNYLQSMAEFQVNGRFSLERFQEILSSSLLSTSEFLELIKTSLLIDQPKLGIIFTSFALPDETNYTISLVNQERDIEYISIPMQYVLSQPIIIPPEKIQDFYNQHRNDFMTPEQVNVEYIQLDLKNLSEKIMPAENALKNFYNENINAYTQPMAWKLVTIEWTMPTDTTQAQTVQKQMNQAVEASTKGEDFVTIANKYNGHLTANHEWVTLSQIPAELQKNVAGITKPGQVTGPVKTSQGFMIAKVTDIKEPQMMSFDAVKDKVRETYVRQHAEEKFAELRDQLADITYERPESLQLAAKTLGLDIKTSELFTKDKAGQDISQYKKVRDTAFSNDVLNLQNNSDVIQLNPETVIVLRIKSHIPSKLLALKDISKQIEEKLKAQEALARTEKFANELKVKLEVGETMQQLANRHHLMWHKAGYLGRYSTKVDSAILDTAFRLPRSSNQHKVVYGVTRMPNGYAIVALYAVKEGSVKDQKQHDIFSEQIQNSEGLLEYELYKQSQTEQANIKIQQ